MSDDIYSDIYFSAPKAPKKIQNIYQMIYIRDIFGAEGAENWKIYMKWYIFSARRRRAKIFGHFFWKIYISNEIYFLKIYISDDIYEELIIYPESVK